jgi:ADP-heptose:LPS heptosyltransferase
VQSLPERSYAVIHLGTGGVQPRWLPERFAAVATLLKQNYGLLPVLSGSPAEMPLSTRCQAYVHEPLLDLTGKITLLELAEVLRHARLLISVDTGVVHLAAAVGTPCITLHFRRVYPPQRWHPWQVPYIAITPSEYCAGCTTQRCNLDSLHCVTSLQTEQVIEAIDQLLTNS